MAELTVDLEGVADLRAQLRKFAPDLAKDLNRVLAVQARSVAKAARANIPIEPMSGWGRWQGDRLAWDAAAVRRGFKPSTARGRRTRAGAYSVIVITQTSAPGAVFEFAGTGGAHGQFVDNLDRWAAPGRAGWRAAEDKAPQVTDAVRRAVDEAQAQLQARIGGM